MAEDGPEASQLRAVVSQSIAAEPPKKGGILAALRRSPFAVRRWWVLTSPAGVKKVARSIYDALSARSPDILSNVTKPVPWKALLAWLSDQVDTGLFIASLTVAEIRRGVLENEKDFEGIEIVNPLRGASS